MKFFKPKKFNSKNELVTACKRQDLLAQRTLYNLYKSTLLGICYRYAKTSSEAEDIFQEAMIKVFTSLETLKDPESVDSWAKAIMIRTAINYYNRTTKQEELKIEINDQAETVPSYDLDAIIGQMDIEILLKVISGLPDGYRVVINMYLIDGYNHAEIAQILSISESTSRSQFSKGKSMLIKKLKQFGITQYEIS